VFDIQQLSVTEKLTVDFFTQPNPTDADFQYLRPRNPENFVTLEEKIRAVEEVFENLALEISLFQSKSSLSCKSGCGKCCFKPDIEATILEFLPFAEFLYQQGIAFDWLEKTATNDSICVLLNPQQLDTGMCTQYKYRGLICRLFGFSARTNKYGKKELVTCTTIKENDSAKYSLAVEQIASGIDVPVMNNHYIRLHAIDYELTREFFPINQAINRAIGVILHYHAYRS
jgi:Fe-S-cluster containining protein